MSSRVFKICMVGEDSCDRNTFLTRFASSSLSDYMENIGMRIYETSMRDNTRLQLWNFTNDSQYAHVINEYERSAHCFMYFFDISREGSLFFLNDRIRTDKKIYNVLVGIKKNEDNTSRELINSFIERHKIDDYFEAEIFDVKSALIFNKITEKLLKRNKEESLI